MSPDVTRKRRRVAEQAAIPYLARRVLLDTHTWLWWQGASTRLGAGARRAITRADDVRLSVVSPWEATIKQALGKLDFPQDAEIADSLARNGFTLLPVSLQHVTNLRLLPPHHRDPFDRLLIAQAQVEGLAIVTADRRFLDYDVAVIDAAS